MTINDIAKAAGVSIATVSRVINGSGYVKEETRQRIESLIREYDYSPNAVARSLIRKDSHMIGLVMPDRIVPFFTYMIDAVERKAEEAGLKVLFFNTGGSVEKEYQALQSVREHQLKGLLITPVIGSSRKNAALLEEIDRSGIPVVLIDREVAEGNFDAVFINNREAAYEATRALAEAGHKKIGIITCPEISKKGQGRLDGYLKYLKEFDLCDDKRYIYRGDFNMESGYEACDYFSKLPDPPTAVLSMNSSETLGCIKYFNENRIATGKDIGLIGFDDIATLTAIGYPVSVIDRPMREMAERAFELFAERSASEEKNYRTKEIILQTHMILRGSERCDFLN